MAWKPKHKSQTNKTDSAQITSSDSQSNQTRKQEQPTKQNESTFAPGTSNEATTLDNGDDKQAGATLNNGTDTSNNTTTEGVAVDSSTVQNDDRKTAQIATEESDGDSDTDGVVLPSSLFPDAGFNVRFQFGEYQVEAQPQQEQTQPEQQSPPQETQRRTTDKDGDVQRLDERTLHHLHNDAPQKPPQPAQNNNPQTQSARAAKTHQRNMNMQARQQQHMMQQREMYGRPVEAEAISPVPIYLNHYMPYSAMPSYPPYDMGEMQQVSMHEHGVPMHDPMLFTYEQMNMSLPGYPQGQIPAENFVQENQSQQGGGGGSDKNVNADDGDQTDGNSEYDARRSASPGSNTQFSPHGQQQGRMPYGDARRQQMIHPQFMGRTPQYPPMHYPYYMPNQYYQGAANPQLTASQLARFQQMSMYKVPAGYGADLRGNGPASVDDHGDGDEAFGSAEDFSGKPSGQELQYERKQQSYLFANDRRAPNPRGQRRPKGRKINMKSGYSEASNPKPAYNENAPKVMLRSFLYPLNS
eukprot:TRINITY_DN2034_c0_g1_i1.p1 TRINITY_DN2034_c0_g1~~TRINITY_DN2034_c0_g1_i1.p1  ORF type:complete len:525 (-),score=95.92 TRINITY_DN2034_c0_g1_i1:246-1820(-)